MGEATNTTAVEAFIQRWQGREGGQERANYISCLNELIALLGLPLPDSADATQENNDYVFERAVKKSAKTRATRPVESIFTRRTASFARPHRAALRASRRPRARTISSMLTFPGVRAAVTARIAMGRADAQRQTASGRIRSRVAHKREGAQVAAELLAAVEQRPSFLSGAVEQTAAVFAALASTSEPVDPKGLADHFKRTKTTEKRGWCGARLACAARLRHHR
jgi:hypothetical protein